MSFSPTANPLPQRTVETLDVIGFSRCLAHDLMPIRRHHRFIGLPESKYSTISLIEQAFMLFCQKNL